MSSVHYSKSHAQANVVGVAVYAAVDSASRAVGRFFQAIAVKFRARQSVQALSGLSDEVLKDIGVSRSEIDYLSRRVAERPGINYHKVSR